MNLKLSSTGLLTIDNAVLIMYPIGLYQYSVSYGRFSAPIDSFPVQLILPTGEVSLIVTVRDGLVDVVVGELSIYSESLKSFYNLELVEFTNRSWRKDSRYRLSHLQLDQARFEFVSNNPTGTYVFSTSSL